MLEILICVVKWLSHGNWLLVDFFASVGFSCNPFIFPVSAERETVETVSSKTFLLLEAQPSGPSSSLQQGKKSTMATWLGLGQFSFIVNKYMWIRVSFSVLSLLKHGSIKFSLIDKLHYRAFPSIIIALFLIHIYVYICIYYIHIHIFYIHIYKYIYLIHIYTYK